MIDTPPGDLGVNQRPHDRSRRWPPRAQHGEYLDSIDRDEWNPADFAYHLSRRARGLPLWFSLVTHGTDAYTQAVETTLSTARLFAAEVDRRTDFTMCWNRSFQWSCSNGSDGTNRGTSSGPDLEPETASRSSFLLAGGRSRAFDIRSETASRPSQRLEHKRNRLSPALAIDVYETPSGGYTRWVNEHLSDIQTLRDNARAHTDHGRSLMLVAPTLNESSQC